MLCGSSEVTFYYIECYHHSSESYFARYGVRALLVLDNGPQYVSLEMKDFASKYEFVQVKSSSHCQRMELPGG